MTIVKDTSAIMYHPLTAIDAEVADLIVRGADAYREDAEIHAFTIRPSLQLLEAYCDITGQRITMDTLRSPAIQEILESFTAAMAGEQLVALAGKLNATLCRRLYHSLKAARATDECLYPLEWHHQLFTPESQVCAKIASATPFQTWYWAGWSILKDGYSNQRKSKSNAHLRMAPLVAHYGQGFVERMYAQIEMYYRNRPSYFRAEWNFMFDYLSEHHSQWPESKLRTEDGAKAFMLEFTHFQFRSAKESGFDGQTKLRSWGQFLTAVETCLCKPGVWTAMDSKFWRPPYKGKQGWETRIEENDDGTLVQEKLLTTIPLHVTDAEAVDTLFYHIKHHLAVVRNWANQQVADLKSRHERRLSLAKDGRVITEYAGKGKAKRYSLEDVCATLEDLDSQVPLSFLCKVYTRVTGEPCDVAHLAHVFGYPVKGSLYPFQCLLVLEHPAITPEFFSGLELYNQEAQLTGVKHDTRQLIGYKNRKSSETSEQVIDLTDTSYAVVQDIIEITGLSRRRLKANGDDTYRLFFVSSQKGINTVGPDVMPLWNDSRLLNNRGLRQKLISQFSPHLKLPEAELMDFIQRVRLGRIRSSAAVALFLKTKCAEAMSRSLGHERYNPALLSHYLPEALLAFIQARWIRIFQKAIVCEAMKDSPYLYRATMFSTMDELNAFLEKHRILEVPPQASDPERKAQKEEVEASEAVLSISVPFLVSLLSLDAAVKASTNRDRVCGAAEFWSSVAEKVQSEIIGGTKRLLKKHLEAALKLIDPKKMEALIYVPAHWA